MLAQMPIVMATVTTTAIILIMVAVVDVLIIGVVALGPH
jgi:hypothetical protein